MHHNHLGIVKSKAVARSYMWWPNIDREIETLIQQCHACQTVLSVPASAPIHPWPLASGPWQRVHVDFAEKNRKCFLLVVDSYAKWPAIFEMTKITSHSIIEKLRSIFAAYGLPKVLVSDNGPQLVSHEFQNFLFNNGIKHIPSAPYKPQSNGQVERFVRIFKEYLSKNVPHDSMAKNITIFLFSYRNSPNISTGQTPSQLFLGRQVRTRLSLLRPDPKTKMFSSQCAQKFYHDSKSSVTRCFFC